MDTTEPTRGTNPYGRTGIPIPQQLVERAEQIHREAGPMAAWRYLREEAPGPNPGSTGWPITYGAWESRAKRKGIKMERHCAPYSLDELAELADTSVPYLKVVEQTGRSYGALRVKAHRMKVLRDAPRSPLPELRAPVLEIRKPLLVMPDIHYPFQHSGWITEAAGLAHEWGADQVLWPGDVVDLYALSKFENGGLPSVEDEIDAYRAGERWFLKYFDKVFWDLGNHDFRFAKQMNYKRSTRGLLTDNFVENKARVVVSDFYCRIVKPADSEEATDHWWIEHPKSHGPRAAVDLVGRYLMNAAIGHTHHSDQTRDQSGRFYGVRIGASCDPTRQSYQACITHGKYAPNLGALILVPEGDRMRHYNIDSDMNLDRLARLYTPADFVSRTDDVEYGAAA